MNYNNKPCPHCGDEIGQGDSYCKPCRAAYLRARRYLGVDVTYARAIGASARHAKKRRAIAYLGGACVRCGWTADDAGKLAALHFHHKARKRFTIATYGTRSWEQLVAELDNCELLCSNCHAIEHHKDGSKTGRPRKAMDDLTQRWINKLSHLPVS